METRKMVIMFLSVLIITACSRQDYVNLTRVDIQKAYPEGNYDDTVIITDAETIKELKGIFLEIKWEPNIEVTMDRREDVLVTLFYSVDENMPEKLYAYRIWFNKNGYSRFISNNEEEGYGSLNEEDSIKLENILIQES